MWKQSDSMYPRLTASVGVLLLMVFSQVALAQGRATDATKMPTGMIAVLGNGRVALPGGYGIALSPDGKLLAAGSEWSAPIPVWDLESMKVVRQLKPPKAIAARSLMWSPGGTLIAGVGAGAEFLIWNAATGEPKWNGKARRFPSSHAIVVKAVRFVDEDRLLASVIKSRDANIWQVELWSVEKGTKSKTWAVDEEKRAVLKELGAGYAIYHVALSAYGSRMAWLASPAREATGEKCAVVIYDTVTGKLVGTIRNLPRTYCVDLADDDTLVLHPERPPVVNKIITAEATVFKISDEKVLFRCQYRFCPGDYVDAWTHARLPASLVDSERTAVRCRDSLLIIDDVGMTRFELKTGKKKDEFDEPFRNVAIAFNGSRIAVRDFRRLGVTSGELSALKCGGTYARSPFVRFSPDGRLLGIDATSEHDGLAHVWNPRTSALLETRIVHAFPANHRYYGYTDFWGSIVAHEVSDGCIETHDLITNQRLAVLEVPRPYAIEITNDGRRVLVASHTGERVDARWFDARSGKELGRFEIPVKGRLEFPRVQWFSYDGSFFGYVGSNRALTLVDCGLKKRMLTFGLTVRGEWKDPKWEYHNIGGDRLIWAQPAITESDVGAVFAEHGVWDRSGRLLRRFTLPAKLVHLNRNMLSPDGRTLAVCVSEKEVAFFETATLRSRGRIPTKQPTFVFKCADFSPDCAMFAIEEDCTIMVWDLARPLSGKTAFAAPKTLREADGLWPMLGDPDPTESDRALWALVKAPEHALEMLKDRLTPVPMPDAKLMEALIKKLDSGNFSERDAAQKELRGMKETALPILREARKTVSVEQGRRLDEVIAEMHARLETLDAVRQYLRELRALEVLERIGGEKARQQVAAVAAGADSVLTYEAQLILARWR